MHLLDDALRDRTRWLLETPRVRLDTLPNGARVVRDDLLHPWAGGNKLRKLDGLLPARLAEGITDLITCGGVQSAHTAAVAALCAERGVRAHILTRGEPLATPCGLAMLTDLFAWRHTFISRDAYHDRDAALTAYRDALPAPERARAAIIPEGAREPDALWGLLRLVRALADALPHPETTPYTLIVDTGTGTTAAGLALAIALANLPWTVHAVMLLPHLKDALITDACALLRDWHALGRPTPPDLNTDLASLPLQWHPRHPHRRFGQIKPQDLQEVKTLARTTGVLTDPIYTLAAWQHLQRLPPTDHPTTVWVHTGGALNLDEVMQRLSR